MFKLGVYQMAGSHGLFSDVQQFRLSPSPGGGCCRVAFGYKNGGYLSFDDYPYLSGTDLYGADSLFIVLRWGGRLPDDTTHRFNSIYVVRRPAPQKETFDVCFNCWDYNYNKWGRNQFNLQDGVSEKYTYNWIGK